MAVGKAVAVAGSRIVVIGHVMDGSLVQAPATATVWISDDGATWRHGIADRGFASPSTIDGVLAGGPGFIAVGRTGGKSQYGSTAVVWSSKDGSAWSLIYESPEPAQFGGIAESSAGIVIVGEVASGGSASEPATWWSSDGTSWQRGTIPGPASGRRVAISSVAAGPDGFVAVGSDTDLVGLNGVPAAWFSTDGRTWQRSVAPATPSSSSHDIEGMEMRHVAANANLYLAVGGSHDTTQIGTTAWLSPDGKRWSLAKLDSATADGGLLSLAQIDAGFLSTGITQSGEMGTSSDGSNWTWTQVSAGSRLSLMFAAAPLGSGFILVGLAKSSLVVWTSS